MMFSEPTTLPPSAVAMKVRAVFALRLDCPMTLFRVSMFMLLTKTYVRPVRRYLHHRRWCTGSGRDEGTGVDATGGSLSVCFGISYMVLQTGC